MTFTLESESLKECPLNLFRPDSKITNYTFHNSALLHINVTYDSTIRYEEEAVIVAVQGNENIQPDRNQLL